MCNCIEQLYRKPFKSEIFWLLFDYWDLNNSRKVSLVIITVVWNSSVAVNLPWHLTFFNKSW